MHHTFVESVFSLCNDLETAKSTGALTSPQMPLAEVARTSVGQGGHVIFCFAGRYRMAH